ncbi:hypothetical protein GCM10027567_18030 [Spongiibacter taiwanensis]
MNKNDRIITEKIIITCDTRGHKIGFIHKNFSLNYIPHLLNLKKLAIDHNKAGR